MRIFASILALFLLWLPVSPYPAAAAETVFLRTQEACYRIPALAEVGGTLLAFAEQRFGYDREKASRDYVYPGGEAQPFPVAKGCNDAGYIDIVLRRSEDGGARWSKTVVVADHSSFLSDHFTMALAGNPTTVTYKDRIILVFSVARTSGRSNNQACMRPRPANAAKCGAAVEMSLWKTVSVDRGVSWDRPERIDIGPYPATAIVRPGPGHGIVLGSGRIVVPGYPWLLLSDDGGKTWRKGATTLTSGLIGSETAIVERPDGTLWASLRPARATFVRNPDAAPFRIEAISADGGETYTSISIDRRFVLPPIQVGLARIGSTFYLSHPAMPGPADGKVAMDDRQRLVIDRLAAGSGDPQSCLIVAGAAGYSDMATLPDGTIGLFYEGDPVIVKDTPDPMQALLYRRIDPAALETCPLH